MKPILSLPSDCLIVAFPSSTDAAIYFQNNKLAVDFGFVRLQKSAPGEVFHILKVCADESESERNNGKIAMHHKIASSAYHSLFHGPTAKKQPTPQSLEERAKEARAAYDKTLEEVGHMALDNELARKAIKRAEKRAHKAAERANALYLSPRFDADGNAEVI